MPKPPKVPQKVRFSCLSRLENHPAFAVDGGSIASLMTFPWPRRCEAVVVFLYQYFRTNGSDILKPLEIHTLFTPRYSLTASTPPSRPTPLSLKPPNGVVKLVDR